MHHPGVGCVYRKMALLQFTDNGLLRVALRFLALDILKEPASIGHLLKNADFRHQHQHRAHGLPIARKLGVKPLRGIGAGGQEKADQNYQQDGSVGNCYFFKVLHRRIAVSLLFQDIVAMDKANFRPTKKN